MTLFQKIKNIVIALLILGFAVLLVCTPDEAFPVIPIVLAMAMIIYGIRLLWYYFRLARFMVGGKSILFQAIIILDVALFTASISAMNSRLVVLIYLIGIYAFSGAIDVMRANEARQAGSAGWKFKFASGIGSLVFVVALILITFLSGNTDIFVYAYAVSLLYSATMRVISAFKRTAIVYIQ